MIVDNLIDHDCKVQLFPLLLFVAILHLHFHLIFSILHVHFAVHFCVAVLYQALLVTFSLLLVGRGGQGLISGQLLLLLAHLLVDLVGVLLSPLVGVVPVLKPFFGTRHCVIYVRVRYGVLSLLWVRMLLRRLLGRGGLRAIVLEICVEEAVPDACPYLGLLVVWLHVGFFHGAMTL